MYKKFLSTLLALCMVLVLMPVAVASAPDKREDEPANTAGTMSGFITATATDNAAGARMTLQQLQKKFPQDAYWNHAPGTANNPDGTTNAPCSHRNHDYYGTCGCNSFSGAIQCYGFALKLGNDACGSNPRNWQTSTASSYVDKLKPGDIIDRNRNANDHTFYVIGVTDTQIKVGECNTGNNCNIDWRGSIDKSVIRG